MAISVIQQSGATPSTFNRQVYSVVLTASNTSSNVLSVTYPIQAIGKPSLSLGNTSGFTYQNPDTGYVSPFSSRYWVSGSPFLLTYGLNMTVPPFPASSTGVAGVDYLHDEEGYVNILGNKKLSFVFSFAPNPEIHNLDQTFTETFTFVNHVNTDERVNVTIKANYGEGSMNVSEIDGAGFTLISHVVGVPKSRLNKIS